MQALNIVYQDRTLSKNVKADIYISGKFHIMKTNKKNSSISRDNLKRAVAVSEGPKEIYSSILNILEHNILLYRLYGKWPEKELLEFFCPVFLISS